MRYVLLFLLTFLFVPVQAQKVRFTDTSNKWSLLLLDADGRSHRSAVQYSGDTFLYNKTYSVSIPKRSFIREDTLLGKIYFLVDSVEHIFFDYTLQQNDTFAMRAIVFRDTLYVKHVVQSVDSVQLGGIFHKVWKMRCITQTSHYICYNYTFIEGIGTTSGPDFQLIPLVFEGCTQLRCFSTKGSYPPCTPAISLPCASGIGIYPYSPASVFDNTTSCNYSIGVKDIPEADVPVIFPNPGSKNVFLRIPARYSKLSLQVMDIAGRIVLEKRVEGGKDFPFYPYILESGIYLYRLQEEHTGQLWVGKFIF